MERLLLYLDDLDDLYGMLGLLNERLRHFLITLFSYVALGAGAMAGIGFALANPSLALATSMLLLVALLYRSVSSSSRRWAPIR